ncbi:MAG: Two-component system sensor histidine kinase [Firmicutes bacterium]|nr:Two-component system sensor histidine kinase [Bacillota bacterium]
MRKSLRGKFLLAFLTTALCSVLLTGLMINRTVDESFYEYMKKNQEDRYSKIVDSLAEYYRQYGSWDKLYISSIARSAMGSVANIRVFDEKGIVIYQSAMGHPQGMMNRRWMGRRWTGEGEDDYSTARLPIEVDGMKVGEVEIGYFGPTVLLSQDIDFKKKVNSILIVSVFLAMALATVASWIFSRKLTKPIIEIINTTSDMSRGNLKKRVTGVEGKDELGELAKSVNRLGEWVENLEDLRIQMTSDVAHELRTPLTIVLSHIEAIKDGIWEATPERLQVCYDEILRLSSLVKDIEKLSGFEKGSLKLEIEEFNLALVAGEVRDNFKILFDEKGVELIADIEEDLVLKGDKGKIKQALINLLSNALKFTDKGGTVKLEAAKKGNDIVIVVEDNGRGILQEDLPFIFERFYRGEKSRNRATGGAGIGLSITKAIIEVHHGTIEVKSEEGKGSRFEMRLPS